MTDDKGTPIKRDSYRYEEFHHGQWFQAGNIGGYSGTANVLGRVAVYKSRVYLCQDKANGQEPGDNSHVKLGYKYGWVLNVSPGGEHKQGKIDVHDLVLFIGTPGPYVLTRYRPVEPDVLAHHKQVEANELINSGELDDLKHTIPVIWTKRGKKWQTRYEGLMHTIQPKEDE